MRISFKSWAKMLAQFRDNNLKSIDVGGIVLKYVLNVFYCGFEKYVIDCILFFIVFYTHLFFLHSFTICLIFLRTATQFVGKLTKNLF